MNRSRVYPNFLYVGSSKAGSTWIYEALKEHPQVYIPQNKEVRFFDLNYQRGEGWYLKYFEGVRQEKAIGELSHDYFLLPEVAPRIKNLLPNCRILFSLRNPVGKMISNYKHAVGRYWVDQGRFDEFVYGEGKNAAPNNEHINLTFDTTNYYKYVNPYFDLFPRNNILIMFFEDLRNDPTKFAQTMYKFLEVDPDFVPAAVGRKVLEAGFVRSKALSKAIFYTAKILRKCGMEDVIGRVKTSKIWYTGLRKKMDDNVEISSEIKQRIRDDRLKSIEDLQKLIGKNVPDDWYQNYV